MQSLFPATSTRASPLARLLFVVYTLLVAYASLYPFSGWLHAGISPFAFLTAPFPRYITVFDITANLLGYLPFGLLCVHALYPQVRGPAAVAVAGLSAVLLSIGLESAQSFLPTRFPSNVDALCNTLGALAGAALGVRYAPLLLEGGPLRRRRAETFQGGILADVGLVLIGLWLFTQLNPAMLLFGAGDLRDLLAASGSAHKPGLFVFIEALTAAANLVAVALLLSAIVTPGRSTSLLIVGLVLLALAVKTAAFAILMQAENVLAWLTPGAQRGLAGGIIAALLAAKLPRALQLVLAAVLLMAATVLVNLAPANPYFAATLKVWQQGHFLNFNGLTRLVTTLWPFAALAYLIWLASQRGIAPGSIWK